MSETFDAQTHLDAMAPAMGLTIDPAWQDTVIANLQATARMAGMVGSFALDDHVEPAPVFVP